MSLIERLKITYPGAQAWSFGDSPEMANSLAYLVIKVIAIRLVCFSDVTEEFAKREGEGDLSLEYWRREHKAFFTRAGFYSDDMELVEEEFEVVDVL